MNDATPARRRRRRRSSRLTVWVGFTMAVVFSVLAGLRASDPRGLNPEIFDLYQRIEPRDWSMDLPVRIVDIDGESLERYGQWPWPRTYFAEMLDRITALGAAVVVFDIVFAEPDRTSPEILREALRRFDANRPPTPNLTPYSSHDTIFARRMASKPVVLGLLLRVGEGPPPLTKASVAIIGADPTDALLRYDTADSPVKALADNASGLGSAGVGDGYSVKVRRSPIFLKIGDKVVPSIAAEALRVAQGARNYVLKSSEPTADAISPAIVGARIGGIDMPLSSDGTVWIRYAGPREGRSLPAWRLLEGTVPDPSLRPLLEGQIVLVGSSAPGLRYLVATPMSEVTDAVTVHAEILEQIVLGTYLHRPDWAPPVEAGLTFLLCLALTLILARHRPFLGTIFGLTAIVAIGGGSWYGFTEHDLLLGPAWPALSLTNTFMVLTLINYFRSDSERQAVRQQFERFVSPDVISEIMEDPSKHLGLGGELREITILFVDVRSFSTMSETMGPETLISFVNDFLGPLSDEILKTGGTIDKYIGDAIMAFWNAPLDQPRHAQRAVEAALAMRRVSLVFNDSFRDRGLPQIDFGIGINTGDCSVGAMGSSRRLDYSCIGDAVNVASRIETLTKTYGIWNLIGQSTAAQIEGFTKVQIDVTTVKGRAGLEPIWTVLGDATLAEREDAARLLAAIDAARKAMDGDDPVEAMRLVDALPALAIPELDPTRLADVFRSRIESRRTAAQVGD